MPRLAAIPVDLSKLTLYEHELSKLDTPMTICSRYNGGSSFSGSSCPGGLLKCQNVRRDDDDEQELWVLPWSRSSPYGTLDSYYPFLYFVLQLRYTPIRRRAENTPEVSAGMPLDRAIFEEAFFLMESTFLCTGLPALQAETIAAGSCKDLTHTLNVALH